MSREPRAIAPSPTDREGWRQAVREASLEAFRMEDIVAAVQHMLRDNDTSLASTLITFLSDKLMRMLTKKVSTNHRNQGKDIIEDAHGVLIAAILQPGSADGKALRTTFGACVRSRLADAIRRERRRDSRESAYELDTEGEIIEPVDRESWLLIGESAVVEEALRTIKDPKKELAFRFFMERVPYESKKGTSISKALGISEKTAREWIGEVQTQLKQWMEARHDRPRKRQP
jgi:DNA-directed RNA polymerase specialized sigma24 family protein